VIAATHTTVNAGRRRVGCRSGIIGRNSLERPHRQRFAADKNTKDGSSLTTRPSGARG